MPEPIHRRPKLSIISLLHYLKLFFRSGLLLAALVDYIIHRMDNPNHLISMVEGRSAVLRIIWIVFIIEMVLRFFPSHTESMGCQKQFVRNYRACNSGTKPQLLSRRRVLLVAGVWIALNAAIGALYFLEWIDAGILLLICLAFSVCDMICILFFCPFQTWFMKNKCCTSCRIYNWDYAMMFTPLIFIRSAYTWSMLLCAILLLIRWEVTVYLHPERFSEKTNVSLACENCTEKLCAHKKQLRRFWAQTKKRYF